MRLAPRCKMGIDDETLTGSGCGAGRRLVQLLGPASAFMCARPEAPWCAVVNTGTGNVVWDCSYRSIEACRPNVLAGNRGFCNLNPRTAARSLSSSAVIRSRHVHRY